MLAFTMLLEQPVLAGDLFTSGDAGYYPETEAPAYDEPYYGEDIPETLTPEVENGENPVYYDEGLPVGEAPSPQAEAVQDAMMPEVTLFDSNLMGETPDGNYVTPGGEEHSIIIEEMTNGSVYSDTYSCAQGGRFTLTLVPYPEYELEGIWVFDQDGLELKPEKNKNRYTYTMGQKDVHVYAGFKRMEYHLLEYVVNGGEFGKIQGRKGDGGWQDERIEACKDQEMSVRILPDGTKNSRCDVFSLETPDGVQVPFQRDGDICYFTMPDANVTAFATFSAPRYTLQAENTVEGVTILDDFAKEAFQGDWITVNVQGSGFNVDLVLTYTDEEGNPHEEIIYGRDYGEQIQTFRFTMRGADTTIRVNAEKRLNSLNIYHPTGGGNSVVKVNGLTSWTASIFDVISIQAMPSQECVTDKVIWSTRQLTREETEAADLLGDPEVHVLSPDQDGLYRFEMPDRAVYIYITFKKTEYNVNLRVNDPGMGTASLTVNGQPVQMADGQASGRAAMDDRLVVTAQPGENYELESIVYRNAYRGDTELTMQTCESYMPRGDLDIEVSFR